MKNLIFLSLIILVACTSQEDRIKEARKEILSTDRAFSAMSSEKGMHAAFLNYAAKELIKLQDGQFPVVGLEALKESFQGTSDSMFRLTWEPVKVEVSISGDLGYTFGNWELYDYQRGKIRYGNYITIWRKQKDGTWRWVLDGGNTTPRPE
jgi:ketosteroid isomerase-like protein